MTDRAILADGKGTCAICRNTLPECLFPLWGWSSLSAPKMDAFDGRKLVTTEVSRELTPEEEQTVIPVCARCPQCPVNRDLTLQVRVRQLRKKPMPFERDSRRSEVVTWGWPLYVSLAWWRVRTIALINSKHQLYRLPVELDSCRRLQNSAHAATQCSAARRSGIKSTHRDIYLFRQQLAASTARWRPPG